MSIPRFTKFISFYAWKLLTRVGNLFSFSSAQPDFSGSVAVIHLLYTVNMAPLCCYVNLNTSLACPMTPTFGNMQTIFLGVLTKSSVINTSLVSCFNLGAKELALTEYLLFSHFVSFVADSFPKCRPDPSCCSCMTRTKQNSKSINPLFVEEEGGKKLFWITLLAWVQQPRMSWEGVHFTKSKGN